MGKMGTKKVHREVKKKLEKEGYFVEDMGFCRGGYKKFKINGLFLIKVAGSPAHGTDQHLKVLLTKIKNKINQN